MNEAGPHIAATAPSSAGRVCPVHGDRWGRHPPGATRDGGHRPGGRPLGTQAFAASTRGYVALVTWAEGFGPVERVGVEGTGTFGAGLTRFVRAYGLAVVEVARPDRSTRRRRGKSDPIDAQAAARATLAGVAAATPKTRDG